MENKQKRTDRNKKKVKKQTKHKKLKIVLSIVVILLLICGATYAGVTYYLKSQLNKVHHVDIIKTPEALGINTDTYKDTDAKDESITNILLLGTDSRSTSDSSGNSDSMMVLTVDKKNNKIKLTSIMRDSIVNVNGTQRKLTEAHGIGGATLTLKTINQNYNLNIKDYVQVDFFSMAKIIDKIGTVPVTLTADEVTFKDYAINFYIKEISAIEKVTPQYITTPGLHQLNGIQAVAYSRIRYVGNADFQRTERQRTVLQEIMKKLSGTNVTSVPGVVTTLAPYIETSMSSDDMLSLAKYAISHNMTNFEQNRVPYDGMWKDAVVNGEDGLTWDKQPTIDKLHQFIFGSTN